MTRPLALLRPEPGWSASAAAARSAGIEVIGHPLFAAESVAWEVPSGSFDALLVGSATAFSLGGGTLSSLTHLPVHAVGAATAEAARAAGFTVALTGEGGLQAVLNDTTDRPRRYLRLAGEERVSLHPQAGQSLTDCVAYRMAARAVEPEFGEALATAAPVIALHSAAAASHFAHEVDRLGVSRRALSLLALGPRIAAAAGYDWKSVHIADRPSDAALLAKAITLCK